MNSKPIESIDVAHVYKRQLRNSVDKFVYYVYWRRTIQVHDSRAYGRAIDTNVGTM